MLPVESLLAKYPDSPFVVLSDFDGTISTEDSNDHLIDNYGMGPAKRKVLWREVVEERDTFRDAFDVSLRSVAEKVSFEECVRISRKGECAFERGRGRGEGEKEGRRGVSSPLSRCLFW